MDWGEFGKNIIGKKMIVLLAVTGAVYFFLQYLTPLLAPVLLAMLFVTIFGPVMKRMNRKLHFPRPLSAIVLLILATLLLAVLLWVLSSWVAAWNTQNVSLYFFNSLVYAIVSCVGVLLISAPGAYVLSRWKFVGGKTIRIGLVIAMSVPTIMIIMPLYSLAVQWGIKGRVLLVVLYIMLRVPYTAIYLLDFFSSLSRSYEEAAYIDGCSHSRTFWQIMLPLVQPAIITVTIFNFMSVWNEFFMALIFTTSDSMTPVGVGLLQIVNAMKYSGQYGAMFAAVIIVFLPTFLLYLFLSEKIIVGATSGGVKG